MALAGGPSVTLTFKGDIDDLRRSVEQVSALVTGLGRTVGMVGVGAGALAGLGAAASAAVLAVTAVPLAFAGIGIAAAAQEQAVKDRFNALKTHVMDAMRVMTASIQGQLLITADHVTAWFDRVRPQLENLFKASAPYITQLTDAVLNFVERAMPGMQTALNNARPVMDALGRGLGMLGDGLGKFFANLSAGAPGAVAGLDALFRLTRDLLAYLGQLIAQLANALGPAFAASAGPIMDIVRALGDFLVPITRALAPLVGELARLFADLIVPALRILTPLFVDLGTTLGGLVADGLRTLGGPLLDLIRMLAEQLRPLLPVVADLFRSLLPVVGDIVRVLTDALRPILPVIIDLFRTMVPIVTDLVKELWEGLKPVIPILTQAFTDMAPTIKEIAERAGPLLIEVVRSLAPLFVELVRGAMDLLKSLLPIIPPLLEMANNAMPLVSGVIKDVLIPIIKWLVEEFKGLIDYGVKIAEEFARLSVRWRTYWDEIKAAFKDAGDKITAGIDAFASLPETARRHWDALYQAIKDRIAAIMVDVVAFPGKMLDAILYPIKRFYEAGQSLIQAFADGINSKASAATDAAGNVVGGTAALFPQSPAKTGPFSGSGYTDERGRKLIEDFGRGIMDAAPNLSRIAEQVMHGLSISGFGRPGSGGTVTAGGVQLQVAPGADSALSSLLMNLVRTGQLQLQRAV